MVILGVRPGRFALPGVGQAITTGMTAAMIDHTTNPDTAEHFDLEVAPRVRGLPPYLFGKINELKYRKRRAGIDVIDLGMGNPTDPPEQWVIDKLCEAAQDDRNHRYSVANGVFNLRKEVADRYERRFNVALDPDHEVVATIGSKEGFSHMCLALLGPGDTAHFDQRHSFEMANAGKRVLRMLWVGTPAIF